MSAPELPLTTTVFGLKGWRNLLWDVPPCRARNQPSFSNRLTSRTSLPPPLLIRPKECMTRQAEIFLRDAAPKDAAEIVRVLIRAKEQSSTAPISAHDRDVDYWHDRRRRSLEHGSAAQHSLGDGFAIVASSSDDTVSFAGYHRTRRWKCDAELESMMFSRNIRDRHEPVARDREAIARRWFHNLCVGYSSGNEYKRFLRQARSG